MSSAWLAYTTPLAAPAAWWPTVLDALEVPIPGHRVEGRSLLPLLRGESPPWRDFVYSELDYG